MLSFFSSPFLLCLVRFFRGNWQRGSFGDVRDLAMLFAEVIFDVGDFGEALKH